MLDRVDKLMEVKLPQSLSGINSIKHSFPGASCYGQRFRGQSNCVSSTHFGSHVVHEDLLPAIYATDLGVGLRMVNSCKRRIWSRLSFAQEWAKAVGSFEEDFKYLLPPRLPRVYGVHSFFICQSSYRFQLIFIPIPTTALPLP